MKSKIILSIIAIAAILIIAYILSVSGQALNKISVEKYIVATIGYLLYTKRKVDI